MAFPRVGRPLSGPDPAHGPRPVPFRKGAFWARLAVSAGLIAFILTRVDTGRLSHLLASVAPVFFLLALASVTLERFLLAYKWNVLLAAKRINIPFHHILKIYYLSNFMGTFLPSSLTVEVVRTYALYKYNADSSESISSVLVDKALSVFSSLTVVLVILAIFSEMIGNPYIAPLAAGAMLALIAGFLLLRSRRLLKGVARRLTPRLRDRLRGLHKSFAAYAGHKGVLFYVFLVSLLFQVVRVAAVFFLSLALGQDVSVVYFYVFVPIVIFLTMLPISLMGIGIREGAFIYFFSQAGMPMADALALSILIYVLNVIAVIPGGVVYITEGLGIREKAAGFKPAAQRPGK